MAVLSRRRQPVDHFIARKPFYRPQWPFYQGQCTFIKPKQPVNHFIARRPFNMAANGRFMKPRQLVDHFIARRPFYRPKAARRPFYRPRWPFYQGQWQLDHFIARRPFYRRFLKPRQPVDHFIARRPFYRRFIKPRQPVDHFIKPVDHFIIQKSSKTRAHPPYRGKWFAPLDLRESI